MRNIRQFICITIPLTALMMGGLVEAEDFWDFYTPISGTMQNNLLTDDDYWSLDREYRDVETPEPSSGKFVPDVPEWVGKDYRDLTPSPDSRERICWDDRPIPKKCYEDGYTYDGCYRMNLTGKQLADFKQFYENRCTNWDWDAYWAEYKVDIDAGRR